MSSIVTFAVPEQLHVEALTFEPGGVVVHASTRNPTARCPECGVESRRVHSRYTRAIADLPCGGMPVRFRVRLRKFFCDNLDCRSKVFAERLDGVARKYARRTHRQREALEEVGFALGGEARSRLAADLGLPTSPDTLLRYIRRLPHLHLEPVRV